MTTIPKKKKPNFSVKNYSANDNEEKLVYMSAAEAHELNLDFDWSKADAMTDEEIRAGILSDPDAVLLSDKELEETYQHFEKAGYKFSI